MADITDQGPVWSLLDVKVEVPSGGQLTDVDLFYARSVQPQPDVTTITFEGDDTSQEVDEVTRWRVTVNCDKQDYDAMQQIFGKTKVTGEDGEAWRMYMGDDTEVAGAQVGLRYTLKYKDESQNPPVTGEMGYRWPLGQVKLIQPQQAEWKAKNVFQLQFVFQKTTVDAAGNPLTDVPANGAPYMVYRPE